MKGKGDKERNATFGSVMGGLIRKQLEATAAYLGYPATPQQKDRWMELGEHVRREIEKEQMKKDAPEGMLS